MTTTISHHSFLPCKSDTYISFNRYHPLPLLSHLDSPRHIASKDIFPTLACLSRNIMMIDSYPSRRRDIFKQSSSSSTHHSSHSALYQRRSNHATPLLQNPYGDCETQVPHRSRLSSAKGTAPICMFTPLTCVSGAVVEAGWPIKI
jgi:hypothetical protein